MSAVKLAPRSRWLVMCFGLLGLVIATAMTGFGFEEGDMILKVGGPLLIALAIGMIIAAIRNRCIVKGGIARGPGKPFKIVDANVVIGPSEPGFYTPWRIQATTENGEHVFLPRTFANFTRTRPPEMATRLCNEIRRGIPGWQAPVCADLRDQ